MDKKYIRKQILNIRNSILDNERKKWDSKILEFLINSDIYKNSTEIFIYVSYNSEVDTKNIIKKALEDNKRIYVPKVDLKHKTMDALNINSLDELSVNNYGILEPKSVDKTKFPNKLDLIIMPGVAFDRKGNRIGYGGGYYDKFISKITYIVNKVALAYEIQIATSIQSEEHDINPDYIITNKEVIKVN